MKTSINKGFTLIELAIVIVIIALIIGGILAGNEVIESAERQTIIKEISDYSNAISTFYSQYNSLPGDMSNASDYWSSADDGDFDGNITGSITENRYAWDHLSKAEIIKLSFSNSSIKTDRPESAIGNSYYKLGTAGSKSTNNEWNHGTSNIYEKSGQYLALGAEMEGGTLDHSGGAINGKSALSIDKKIDDGNASAGNFIATKAYYWTGSLNSYLTGCTDDAGGDYSSQDAGTANYDLSNDDETCRVFYFYSQFD